mmetsp:Transcript_37848/g.74431  ORF Transcript_37848/g.74431 Transcript_37848/m.74431 type:complete len:91 (-) Transcript_37848:376-648(-)
MPVVTTHAHWKAAGSFLFLPRDGPDSPALPSNCMQTSGPINRSKGLRRRKELRGRLQGREGKKKKEGAEPQPGLKPEAPTGMRPHETVKV